MSSQDTQVADFWLVSFDIILFSLEFVNFCCIVTVLWKNLKTPLQMRPSAFSDQQGWGTYVITRYAGICATSLHAFASFSQNLLMRFFINDCENIFIRLLSHTIIMGEFMFVPAIFVCSTVNYLSFFKSKNLEKVNRSDVWQSNFWCLVASIFAWALLKYAPSDHFHIQQHAHYCLLNPETQSMFITIQTVSALLGSFV